MAITVILLPFLVYTHLLFDDNVAFIEFFDYSFQHRYNSNQVLSWVLLINIIPILILIQWFLSSSSWWKPFILFPLLIFPYNLYNIINLIIVGTDSPKFAFLFTSGFIVTLIILDNLISKKYRYNKILLASNPIQNMNYRAIYKNYFSNVKSIRKTKNVTDSAHYIKRIYHLRSSLNRVVTDDIYYPKIKNRNQQILIDLSICIILILMPIMSFLVEIVPAGLQQLDLFFFVIGNNGFGDLYTFMWVISMKLVILVPLCIWYITCQDWWKYSILIPIILYTYQIWEAIIGEQYLDAYGNLSILPTILFVVCFVLLLSHLVKYKSRILDIYDSITSEIEELLKRLDQTDHDLADKKMQFSSLVRTKVTEENKKEHLRSLIQLKEELEQQLGNKSKE